MKQNHNKTTLSSNEICLLSSTCPQGAAHLPGLTSWVWFMPFHFHTNVLQSRGRNIYSHLRITNEVYRNKEDTECTDSPSQILSTIWGDYTFLQLCEAYWERSPVDVLRTWLLLVCGPGEGDTQMYGRRAHSVEAYIVAVEIKPRWMEQSESKCPTAREKGIQGREKRGPMGSRKASWMRYN